MGLSFYLIRDIRIRVYGERFARFQPVIYGAGMFLFILGLFISGAFGAPRKTYGVAFTSDPVVLASLTIMGIGTILAVTGGIIFVTYITVTLVKGGKRYEMSS
jgi:heme/copper-type cytochrome/quinol oxidase subunit 1